MSGPLQWNGRTGQMVPAGSTLLLGGTDAELEPIGAPPNSIEARETATAPTKPKAKKEKATTPKDIVALAKARLREVKQELRRMNTLEKECGELERLIAAAEDNKPRAVVRELKKTAG